MKCFECGGDHFRRVCPKLSGAKPEQKKCYNCRKPVHYAKSCPERGGGDLKCHDNNKVKSELIVFGVVKHVMLVCVMYA